MAQAPNSPSLRIEPRRVTVGLAALVALLFLASLLSQLSTYVWGHDWGFGFIPKLFMDTESGPATFFSTLLLLLAAAALAVITALRAKAQDRFRRHWLVLAIGFFLMALDEASSLHELLIKPLRESLDVGGILHYAWVLVGFGVVIVVGIAYLPFLKHLSKRTRNAFFIAAVLYVGGALIIELFEGKHVEAHGIHNLTYGIIVTVEETLEMVGLVVFLHALLTLLAHEHGSVRFDVGPVEVGSDPS